MPQKDLFGIGGLAYLAAWRENRFTEVRRVRKGLAARFHAKAQGTQRRKRISLGLAAWRTWRLGVRTDSPGSGGAGGLGGSVSRKGAKYAMPQKDLFGTGGLAYLAAWRENRFTEVRRVRKGSAARFHAKAQSTQCRKRISLGLAAWRTLRLGVRTGSPGSGGVRKGSAVRFHAKAQSTQCRKRISLALAAWRTWRLGVRTDSPGSGGGERARRSGFTQRRKVRNAAKGSLWHWRLGVLGGVRTGSPGFGGCDETFSIDYRRRQNPEPIPGHPY